MCDQSPETPWKNDLLGYQAIGETFGNLVSSIEESKVISIEAGFGRGKTFFRTAWAEHLRQHGEIVIEIDAQKSDHSGDPVVTFIGALVGHLPPEDKTGRQKAYERGKAVAALAARSAARIALRNGADELIEGLTESAADQVEGVEVLEDTVKDLGEGMSKLAGKMIAAQLASEQVRQKELPDQLTALHEALTKDSKAQRIVILIDELDRCHPEYALALLEAMKLVFDHPGFVFCLMVNADYLENLAAHRFGRTAVGERYLDKFVDIRLKLPVTDKALSAAVQQLTTQLPRFIPFGDGAPFSINAAAELAGEIAPVSGLSMRQIKNLLLKLELALRCYGDRPIDLPLMVFLAFRDAIAALPKEINVTGTPDIEEYLPRAKLTPRVAKKYGDRFRTAAERSHEEERRAIHDIQSFIATHCKELGGLPDENYGSPDTGPNYPSWARIMLHLAPHYVPDHQSMLDAVHQLQV